MKKFTKFCLLLAIFIIAGNWAYAAQVTVTVGTGTDVTGNYETAITPFGTYYEDGQNQMLFTALELNIAGIGAGDITEIGWEVISAGGAMNGFNIEMKHTSATSATSFESGFTNVYSTAYTPVAGWNVITLTTPFNWDGTSNLLVKVCFDNTSYTSNSTVYYTSGSYADMNAYFFDDGASGCSGAYQGTTNRPNTRITGEEFTGMLPPGEPTNPSPVDGETGVAITGDLTWDFGSDTDTYDLWYGPAGSMIQVVTGEIAGATGLYEDYAADYFTTYEWQVIAYNSAKGTTNGPVWTFKTKCDVFTAPFSENFDGVTPPALPDCWSKIENPSYGYVQTYANYSYSAPNCLRMRKTNLSYRFILITPELSDLTSQSNRIRFQGQALYVLQDLIVGTMSDPADEATFTPYQTITLSLDSYTEYTVDFDANYTLTDKYIAFEDASTSIYRIMTVDDFVYEPIPSCLKPTDLTATNNGITSVYLGWTENNSPPATSWEIEYGDQGFTQGAGTTVIADANPFHLTGLTIDHDYSFYVRTNCGDGDYSAWSDPFDFSTIDGKATNPDPANNATFVLITAKTFNWDDVIDADNYTIDIGTATGLADLVDDAFCATSDYTYTGADWDYNEDYYWTVTTVYTAKADVTGDEWKFTTECDAVSTFPWLEGFENGGAIPSCWSQEYETGTHDWGFQNGDNGSLSAHGGSYNAAFTHTTKGTVTKLVTPALDLSGLTSPVLTFWHAQTVWGGDQDELRVYYKTSAGGTWTLIPGAEWTGNIPNWTEETFTLPSPGSDYYIAFEGTDDYGYGVVVDDVSVYSEAQTSIWTGALSSDWFEGGNWSLGTIPAGGDVEIPNVAKAPFPTIAGGLAITGTLTIFPAAMLTVGPTGGLTTNGLFTNDGSFYITSDATGSAGSFIDNGGLAGAGTFRFDRFMNNELVGGVPNNGWHLISSPVDNTVSGDFTSYYVNEWLENINFYNAIDPYPGPTFCDGTSFGNIAMNPMYGFAAKRDLGYPGACPCPSGCWVPPLDQMPNMFPDVIAFGGDAYGAFNPSLSGCNTWPGWNWVDAATAPAFMVNVNTGAQSINVTGHDFSTGGIYDNWNLIGNPYPSPIDNATFVPNFPAQVDQSVYYYDDLNLTYQVWAAGVGVPQVPATQGFFVHVNTSVPVPGVPIGLTNLDRTHTGANVFYKSDIQDLLVLEAAGNGYADKTYVRFLDEATTTFDNKYDAYKLMSYAPLVPQIYTTESNNFAINVLPEIKPVHLSFTAGTSGLYTIEAIETSEFAHVVLEDVATGEQTNLLADSYTFDFTEGTKEFIVHFTPLGTPELEANSINIWSADHTIYVNVPRATNGDIVVFNMMGQEVIRTDIEPGLNTIPMDDVNTYYVVKVLTSDNAVAGKVFIK